MVQGDKEKAAGLPVSPLMDRSMKGGMTRSQVCSATPRPQNPLAHPLADPFVRPAWLSIGVQYNTCCQWMASMPIFSTRLSCVRVEGSTP